MSEEDIVLTEIRHHDKEIPTGELEKDDQVADETGNGKLVHFENCLAINELEEEEEAVEKNSREENTVQEKSVEFTGQKELPNKVPPHKHVLLKSNSKYSLQRNTTPGLLELKAKPDLINERDLKVAIYSHISNPLKRWKVGRFVPWKMILQVIKTLTVILQASLFLVTVPNEREIFLVESRVVFEDLFIKSFNPSDTIKLTYTAFSPQQLFSEISYVAERYHQIPQLTIGGFDHQLNESGSAVPILATLQQYKVADLSPSTDTYILDSSPVTNSFNLTMGDTNDIIDQLTDNGLDLTFNRFIDLQLSFPVKSIWIVNGKAQCFRFLVKLLYTNKGHHGKIFYSLNTDVAKLQCNGSVISSTASQTAITAVATVVDVVVIILCIVSFILTVKSFVTSFILSKALGDFYHDQLKLNLSWWDRTPLFTTWVVFSVFTDIVLVIGSAAKISLEFNASINTTYVRILLGTALVLQAGTILRYASYFKQLNALTRTLNKAFPELLKFLLCTSVLFFAFALCGFVVFEPYNERFKDFSNSLESLFVLINGDDIFPTFRSFSPHPDDIGVYVYSRIFIYIFVALFVTAVLNLFTSLIISSYESTLDLNRATINEVRKFVFSGPLTPEGVALRDITYVRKYVDPSAILDKKKRKKPAYIIQEVTPEGEDL